MPDERTKDQYVRLAWNAASKAATLAGHAELNAHSLDRVNQERVPLFAAAGAVWADVARTYTAIAAILPEPTDPQDGQDAEQDAEDAHV